MDPEMRNTAGNNHKEDNIMKLATVFFAACIILSSAASAEAQNGRGFRNGGQYRNPYCPRFDATAPLQPLSAEEGARLLFLREEEKLALDVYQAFFQKYQYRIFSNIASSEKRHFDAIKVLIDRYELSDPAQPMAGVFSDRTLQELYDNLLARGQRSLADALQVGVIIENKDIADLKDAISATDNTDILTVYGNLMQGSLNHLSAFGGHSRITNIR
jgi:hypothetical protein